MKGTIYAAVLVCSAVLAACSPAAAKETMAASQSPSSAVTEASMEPSSADMADQGESAEDAYHKISAEEAKQMIDKGGVTIVDVRTAEEYADGHIPDSILVPVETIGDAQPEELPDLDAVLLVHCRTGIRSKRASDQLVALGYKHVYDFGGIVDWPYDTVKE